MKHICAALLAALLALSCLAVTAFADGTEGGRMYGDVNGDGKVNPLDKIILARHLADWQGYETLPYTK